MCVCVCVCVSVCVCVCVKKIIERNIERLLFIYLFKLFSIFQGI